MPTESPLLTVVIPALNEAGVIGRCLSSLARQDAARRCFEVIVADNGSSDNTREIARSFQGGLDLRILTQPHVSISTLRNFGAANARGRYLAFLDADCLAPRGWARTAAGTLGETEGLVTGAPYRIPEDSGWVARAWYGGAAKRSGAVRYLPGGCLTMSRATFEQLDGFDASLETAEDYDICRRAIHLGLPVCADERLAVVHLGTPDTVRGFFSKQLWHGKHVLRGLLKDIPAMQGAGSVAMGFLTAILVPASVAGLALLAVVDYQPALLAPLLLFAAMCGLLAARACVKRRSFRYFVSLVALNAVYCCARACCLAGFSRDYQTARAISRRKAEAA
ncbi:MAG: glycosyltransferase [Acidobacteriota bacterium]|nr:glycosyltransferase [Acidobacteriota bacterium]